MDKTWKTSIAGIVEGETLIHGYKVIDLIDKVNFTDAIGWS